jgi:hypothetical protein
MAKPQDENRVLTQAISQEARNTPSPCCRVQMPGGRHFEIRVKGHLSANWSDWLEGLELTPLESDEMVLGGTIVDQAALMGILNKLNRLNLTILSVNEVNPKE